MDKVYQHSKFEKDIYKIWEKSGAFAPSGKGAPYCIIMPPPNANDPLHIGHAREVATQDTLIRYHRMKGESTLWLPGADHAGIETQFVFEKKLKAEGKSRFDFDRETLYQMIWNYVQKNRHIMEDQLRKLGASCDWSRKKFTLDPKIIKIVYKTFKKLYDEGLIYRGERIINYCPRCGTAYSQLEIDTVERDDNLYYFDYGTVTIATTRPETIFADVAIAVNPKDSRYKKLIGKTAKLPLVGRELPIIADNLVDIKFGTGALKITPGHDATDFEIGQKHNLTAISVIDSEGKMINCPEKYIGMKAEVAREEVVKDLQEAGKLKKTEKIHHLVGICYKDKGLIEPIISKQWFLKVKPLAELGLSSLEKGEIKFTAKKFEKIAKYWFKILKDWNISRQLVWGIRIPAWRCEKCLEWTITDGKTPTRCSYCQNTNLKQDEDTFDTWFSSGQWPYATLQSGQKDDFKNFYPTSVMDPAYDILPFWVIRMIMLGLYSTGKIPFEKVLLHGLVRDKNGVKISKSKGNVIDPIVMAEKYGADALRIGSIWGTLIENDNCLSEDNIRGQRNFANKIWNASRFVLEHLNSETKKGKLDKEIKENLKTTIREVTKKFERMELNQAAELLYSWFWNKYCNQYIEKSKKGEISKKTMTEVLAINLKLLHPLMPFITEVVWQEGRKRNLKEFDSPLLISASWPKI
jgi:valyl-tRNA synthetase